MKESIFSAVILLIVAISTSTLNIRIREQELLRVREQEKLRSESEKERMRGNLLRTISHDLRTLLLFYPQHPVADADVRLDVLLAAFSAFQLFAQSRHKYPQGSNIVFPTAAPDLLCDVGVGQNLAHIF